MFHRYFCLTAVSLFILSFATPAYAYIGPAIVVLSSIVGPVVAFVVVIILTLFYPVLKLYRKIRSGSQEASEETESAEENDLKHN